MFKAKRIESTIKPKPIVKLSNNEYYYNYDVKSKILAVGGLDGLKHDEIRYSYVQVKLAGTPSYAKCVLATIRAFITEALEFDLINKYAAQDIDLDTNIDTEYVEYLALLQEIKHKVKVDFNLATEDLVEDAKTKKLLQISLYDKSNAVNEFTYQNTPMWLDKNTRNGLLMRLNAEKSAGKTTTTLWFDTQSFTLNIDELIAMINLLEVYASECYDRTAYHKAAVKALTTVEEVNNYNYTTGYPEKLEF